MTEKILKGITKDMQISTRGRYALRIMLDLAIYGKGELVKVKDIASRQEISEKYMEQIMSVLKKAGYVKSIRGAQGGYALSRPPEEINVGEILRVLEGSTTVIDCVSSEHVSCDNACSCSARPLWLKLQASINEVLSATSLKDMADDYRTQTERTLDK